MANNAANDLGIGKLITSLQGKDAIHIAVAPMTAAHCLHPGERVGLVKTDYGDCGLCDRADCIGIVDPFLGETVKAGERFWLFLDPGTVTSLRHVWTHPAFTAAAKEKT